MGFLVRCNDAYVLYLHGLVLYFRVAVSLIAAGSSLQSCG